MQGDLHIMEGFHQQSKILQESNATNDVGDQTRRRHHQTKMISDDYL